MRALRKDGNKKSHPLSLTLKSDDTTRLMSFIKKPIIGQNKLWLGPQIKQKPKSQPHTVNVIKKVIYYVCKYIDIFSCLVLFFSVGSHLKNYEYIN